MLQPRICWARVVGMHDDIIANTTLRPPHACSLQNTVVGTVASASFLPGLMNLADSAAGVGFPCIVVQPFDWFDALLHERLVALPVASPPLAPQLTQQHVQEREPLVVASHPQQVLSSDGYDMAASADAEPEPPAAI